MVRTRSGSVAEDLIAPNSERSYRVHREALPLSCPLPGMYLWNSHPKVFLPIEATGEAKCPYCGAHFTLVDNEP